MPSRGRFAVRQRRPHHSFPRLTPSSRPAVASWQPIVVSWRFVSRVVSTDESRRCDFESRRRHPESRHRRPEWRHRDPGVPSPLPYGTGVATHRSPRRYPSVLSSRSLVASPQPLRPSIAIASRLVATAPSIRRDDRVASSRSSRRFNAIVNRVVATASGPVATSSRFQTTALRIVRKGFRVFVTSPHPFRGRHVPVT